jgi:2-oxoglutarate/2-oxoacid ferredoxin oxidoreductase subunit alpha
MNRKSMEVHMYNILIGGEAGQGIDTTSFILEKFFKKSGYYVFTTKDFMSRVRGGHNFSLLRFGNEIITSHSNKVDVIIALNDETIELHSNKLKDNGFILCDSGLNSDGPQIIKFDINKMAKEIGNINVAGSIAVGVILKMFNENLDGLEDIIRASTKEKNIEVNVKAVKAGYGIADSMFLSKNGEFSDWMLISGNKALALGAIAAGVKFYSAYPMSPSTSIMDYIASKSNEAEIVVEQAEDEIAAMNMAIGASFAGVRSMTATSGGGFCLMVEALGLSGVAEIPVVVVDVQRPGPATGLATRTEQSDLKFVISASQGEFPRMVIALRNHTDAFYQTVRAFNLSEKYQIPVIILSDQYLADTSSSVKPYDLSKVSWELPITAPQKEEEYLRYRYTDNYVSPRLIPGKSRNFVTADSHEHDEQGWICEEAKTRVKMVDKRMKKLERLIEEDLQDPEFIGFENCETLIVGWGSTYGAIVEAIKNLNNDGKKKYGALVFGDVYPLPEKLLREKAMVTNNIINVEQNATGQLASLIREKTGIECSQSILRYDGRQISAEEIVSQIFKGGDQ